MASAISFAVTRSINPASESPVLSEEQVWAGLGFKACHPETFVKAISKSEVVEDEGSRVRYMVSAPLHNQLLKSPEILDSSKGHIWIGGTGFGNDRAFFAHYSSPISSPYPPLSNLKVSYSIGIFLCTCNQNNKRRLVRPRR
jgi:UV DNA damage repair endonuclease